MPNPEYFGTTGQPPAEFFTNPWLPTGEDLDEWDSLIISPGIALTILVNYGTNPQMTLALRECLQTIRDGREAQDLKQLLTDHRVNDYP
jgi:hypothetical protein